MSNVQIMCAWCQKVGIKRYSLSMGSEVKSFCSEKCFAACRRAYFKRNKVRHDGKLHHLKLLLCKKLRFLNLYFFYSNKVIVLALLQTLLFKEMWIPPFIRID